MSTDVQDALAQMWKWADDYDYIHEDSVRLRFPRPALSRVEQALAEQDRTAEGGQELARLARLAGLQSDEIVSLQARLAAADDLAKRLREERDEAQATLDQVGAILTSSHEPEDEVIRFFQRLHGLPEVGRIPTQAEAECQRLRDGLRRIAEEGVCTADGVSSKHEHFCAVHEARSLLSTQPEPASREETA